MQNTNPKIPPQKPDDAVETLVRGAHSSFTLGMRLLPDAERRALFSIYAFCRLADDAADQQELAVASAILEEYQSLIDLIYLSPAAIEALPPIFAALAGSIHQFQLSKKYFDHILQGCTLDIEKPILRPTLQELLEYCDLVASPVGLLAMEIAGFRHQAAQDYATYLGRGFQLINILRDVVENASQNRVYLPHEYLNESNIAAITPAHILANPHRPGLIHVYEKLGGLAGEYLQQAQLQLQRHFTKQERKKLNFSRMMHAVYAHYLAQMQSRHYRFTKAQIYLSKIDKLKLHLRNRF